MSRPAAERGTLGEELYAVLLRDLARSPRNGDGKALALESEGDAFVLAVDTVLPADALPAFEAFVLELLPLWDDDTLPDLVRKLAEIYDALARDQDVQAAWLRIVDQRAGYVHDAAVVDTIERLAEFPRLRDLALFTTDLVLAHDGLDATGAEDPAEADHLRALLRSVRDTLREPADPTDRYRTSYLLGDLLLRPDARFAVPGAVTEPLLAVRLDPRGVVQANTASRLFSDADGDRLIDLTPDGTAFLSRTSRPFRVAPYGPPLESFALSEAGAVLRRDELGRALTDTEDFVYDYVDLNQTPLGYVIRRTPELIERGVILDTFEGLHGVLGPVVETDGAAHYSADTALLDVAEAALLALDYDAVETLLETGAALLRAHEDTLATLMVVFERNGDVAERYDAALAPNNTLVDDLLPYVYELAQEPGLLEDLATALRDPISREILPSIADLGAHWNPAIRPAPDGPYNSSVASCLGVYPVGSRERFDCLRSGDRSDIFVGEVDPRQPEGDENTSLAQRLMHLIHDGTDAPFEMYLEAATLFDANLTEVTAIGTILTIPDVAVAFFDSIAGNFCIIDHVEVDRILANETTAGIVRLAELLGVTTSDPDDIAQLMTDIIVLLSDNLGVHMDECPGPDQMLRFFNLPRYEMELGPFYARLASGTCNEGYLFQEHHADALFAAEATGSLDALYPVIKVFSDRGLTPLLADLIRDMYRHYPEPGAVYTRADGTPTDSLFTGIRSYEGAMVEIFGDPAMSDAIIEVVSVLQDLELTSGEDPVAALQGLLLNVLAPTPGLATRGGIATATRGDGSETEMTRFYLLSEAREALDAQLDEAPAAREAWERASEALTDLLLEVEEDADGRGVFVDRGAAALATAVLEHARTHFRRHRAEGDLSTLLTTDYLDELESLLTARGLYAAVQLIDEVRADPADQALFDELLLYLTEEDASTERAAISIAYAAILGTSDARSYPAIASFFAEVLDPDRRFAVEATADLPLPTHLAQLLQRAVELDEEGVAIDLLVRGIVPSAGVEAPFTVIGRVLRQINRVDAGSLEPVTTADLAALYAEIAAYIRDDRRGLERAFTLVQERNGAQR